MQIYDISMPIFKEMAVYKNKEEKKPAIEITSNFEKVNGTRESRLTLELHTGTHMDAPLHMIKDGQDSTFFKLEDMVASCIVLDMTHVEDKISKADLEVKDIHSGKFILLKTKNSYEDEFNSSFVYVDRSGAEYLAQQKIMGVGIDSMGIERAQPDHMTHKILLGSGIHILEGLRLKDISEGEYTLVAAPLNILYVEASPVRALLLDRL